MVEISNLCKLKVMYLPRVQANPQMKSESLQTKEDTIKRKLRQLVCNKLVVRQQTHGNGMNALGKEDTKV